MEEVEHVVLFNLNEFHLSASIYQYRKQINKEILGVDEEERKKKRGIWKKPVKGVKEEKCLRNGNPRRHVEESNVAMFSICR